MMTNILKNLLVTVDSYESRYQKVFRIAEYKIEVKF